MLSVAIPETTLTLRRLLCTLSTATRTVSFDDRPRARSSLQPRAAVQNRNGGGRTHLATNSQWPWDEDECRGHGMRTRFASHRLFWLFRLFRLFRLSGCSGCLAVQAVPATQAVSAVPPVLTASIVRGTGDSRPGAVERTNIHQVSKKDPECNILDRNIKFSSR